MYFVSAWYPKDAALLVSCHSREGGNTVAVSPRCAFVATNSITQVEQVGVLWCEILRHGFHICFAHRTFQWNNEAKGVAAVHCVIVGFSEASIAPKRLFDYEDIRGEAHEVVAANINPYLVDAPDLLLSKRSKPVSVVPEIAFGSMPNDGGNLLLEDDERESLLALEPAAANWIRPFRSEEHTSELQSLMRISYAVFCLKKKKTE